jgi:hypothetical protein
VGAAVSAAAKPLTTAEVEELHTLHAEGNDTRVAVDRAQLLATTRALEAEVAERKRALVCDVCGRCPRCHRDAPNPDGCAACNPVRLGERLTEALAEIELRVMHAPPPTIVLTTDDSVTALGEMLKASVARAEKAERERDEARARVAELGGQRALLRLLDEAKAKGGG